MSYKYDNGNFVGRVWSKFENGPLIVKVNDGYLYDITSTEIPTMRDLLEKESPSDYISNIKGKKIISLNEIEENIKSKNFDGDFNFLAPCDLQVIKACGNFLKIDG